MRPVELDMKVRERLVRAHPSEIEPTWPLPDRFVDPFDPFVPLHAGAAKVIAP